MSASLGQQVIVENRPGAGSTIGFKAAAAADPDGYTLLFGSSGSLGVAPRSIRASMSIRSSISPRSPPRRCCRTFMVVGRTCRRRDGRGIRRLRKANPGKLKLRRGIGTPPASALDAVQDPGGPRRHLHPIQGLGAVGDRPDWRQTHFTIDGMLILIPQVKAGKLRALAVGRAERWPDLPDVRRS